MMKAIEIPQSYTFSDYFKLNFYIEDILSYFGYSFEVQNLVLPKSNAQLERLTDLRQRLEENLLSITLDSELARREFLIAPVLMDLLHYTHAKLKIAYPLTVSEQLKGSLDYFLQSQNNLLVIEAKDENLERGFKQLAVELIAIDRAIETEHNVLYGAVSIGKVWQFGLLHCDRKQFIQDVNLYLVPKELDSLMSTLVAILESPS